MLSSQETEEPNTKVKPLAKDNFKKTCIRNRKSKNCVLRTQFNKNSTPTQLQERADKELNKLINENHIIK